MQDEVRNNFISHKKNTKFGIVAFFVFKESSAFDQGELDRFSIRCGTLTL